MILVVDDERTFKNSDDSIIYARTSDEAINILKNTKVDELWLDHDLGGTDTTMKVVDYLVEHKDEYPTVVILVHSMNPVGAQNIIRALERYYRVGITTLPVCI